MLLLCLKLPLTRRIRVKVKDVITPTGPYVIELLYLCHYLVFYYLFLHLLYFGCTYLSFFLHARCTHWGLLPWLFSQPGALSLWISSELISSVPVSLSLKADVAFPLGFLLTAPSPHFALKPWPLYYLIILLFLQEHLSPSPTWQNLFVTFLI